MITKILLHILTPVICTIAVASAAVLVLYGMGLIPQ